MPRLDSLRSSPLPARVSSTMKRRKRFIRSAVAKIPLARILCNSARISPEEMELACLAGLIALGVPLLERTFPRFHALPLLRTIVSPGSQGSRKPLWEQRGFPLNEDQ